MKTYFRTKLIKANDLQGLEQMVLDFEDDHRVTDVQLVVTKTDDRMTGMTYIANISYCDLANEDEAL